PCRQRALQGKAPRPRSRGKLGSSENLPQLERGRCLELVVAAIVWRLVGPPAQEMRRMTEAIALQMVVPDFAYAFDPQRLPRQVFIAGPAALRAGQPRNGMRFGIHPVTPGMIDVRSLAQRLDQLRELFSRLHRKRRCHTDV